MSPHDSWYLISKLQEKAYDLDVDTDEAADHRLTIFINHQVRDADGRFLGIAGVGNYYAGIFPVFWKHSSRNSAGKYSLQTNSV